MKCHKEVVLKWERHNRGVGIDVLILKQGIAPTKYLRQCNISFNGHYHYVGTRKKKWEPSFDYQLLKLWAANSDGPETVVTKLKLLN